MSCSVGHRHSSDLALLWLWCGLAAEGLIRTPARELPHTKGVALKDERKNERMKRRKKEKQKERKEGRKKERK